MDATSPTAWDDLELKVKEVPEGEYLSLRFRFDPKGPPPHTTCPALPLRRDEELETQVIRHLEQHRAPPGAWELRLCVNNTFLVQRLVRVAFPPPPQASAEPVAIPPGPGGVTLTGPLTGDELLRRVLQHIEDAEQLKMALGLVPEEDEEEAAAASAPPPEPLWLQAVRSEKAELLFAKLGTFLDGWLDAKLEEQRAKTSVARARAEQMGATPPPLREGPPTVRLHSINGELVHGEPPPKVED
ncbi:MAG TPA: hypothetical protein VFA20_08600 [Myxococcaceae bacterium]|nr:hypothetical protein [Myxococcaceae bacterium]